jgi:tRNA threonylcarbamoyladenosine biosynthesis protein TsaE
MSRSRTRPAPSALESSSERRDGASGEALARVAESRSGEETRLLGARLARGLGPGSVVALTGPLGTGKTVFVKGIVEGLSGAEEATSPSFTLVNVYEAAFPVYHFDFYRLATGEDPESLGFRDYLDGRGVVLIEWADRAPASLPEDRLEVGFERTGEHSRSLRLRAFGPCARRALGHFAPD